jgi:hypothetical protein
MKKTIHTKALGIGDIVVAFHDQNANCGNNDCYERFIGGYVVSISEAIVGIKVADTVIEVNREHGVIVEKVPNLSPQRLGQLLIDFYKLAPEYVRYEVLLAELDLLKASKANGYTVLLAELDLLKVEMDLLLDDMEFIISNTQDE